MTSTDEMYQKFINQIRILLLSNDWDFTKDVPDPFTHMFSRTDQKTIVFTHQALVFLNDTGLSQQQISALVEKVHTWEETEGQSPLFPATTILVFTQDKPRHLEWIQKHGKKRSVLKSQFTLPWVASLQNKTLYRHQGLPLVKAGAQEIQEALQHL